MRTIQAGFKVTQDTGVLIVRVMKDSPAASGGLQPGDIIQKVADKPIKSAAEVQQQVESSALGQDLQIEVTRQGKTEKLRVRPEAFPTQQQPEQ